MFQDVFAKSDLLVWPMMGLLIFVMIFVGVLAYVFLGLRDKDKIDRMACRKWSESKFSLEEALKADEAFISGASSYVLPVVQIDEQEIGGGTPGPCYQNLRKIYIEHARAGAI